MVIYALLFSLLTSFIIHVIILALYLKERTVKYFYWFIATVATNMGIALVLVSLAMSRPEMIRELNLKFFFWLLSGFIMLLMLAAKIHIFRNIYRRTQDPAWYHRNYFGKKVYEKGIVKQIEFFGIFLTLPFFLFFGAFFVSRLLVIIRGGHL